MASGQSEMLVKLCHVSSHCECRVILHLSLNVFVPGAEINPAVAARE